jgi:hypothetical protein
MDIIITAIGEFIWTASYVISIVNNILVSSMFTLYSRCAVVNFCLGSGLSVLAVFISFLCAILASAFYKYRTSASNTSQDNQHDNDKSLAISSSTEPLLSSTTLPAMTVDINESHGASSLSEIEIQVEDNPEEQVQQQEQLSEEILIDTIERSEAEIQKQQIANIYRLLNDQHLLSNWTTDDFLDQLKMYGLQEYHENELESSPVSAE